MLVTFTKARHDDRPHTFTCTRDDGSVTGMPSSMFFVHHDLTHFAVETILGFDEAFYGLLAKGWDIDAFEQREPGQRKARQVPPQAADAEVLAGAFDLQWTAGRMSAADILAAVEGRCKTVVTEEQIDAIQAKRDELFAAWRAVQPGEKLELTFPAA